VCLDPFRSYLELQASTETDHGRDDRFVIGILLKIPHEAAINLDVIDRELLQMGERGIQACQADMPDVILLDWNMPVMDGYSFLRSLRVMPEGQSPKVVFCTTENDIGQITRALDAGANEYIMKPFDRDILTAKFQELGVLVEPYST
jgi:two-component system chemotaxis response regulator CheY